MAQSHEEVGVQVEAIARQDRLFRRATATDAGVSFDDRDVQTGPCQIGGKRESVVSGSDDDTIELFHSLLPTTASTLLHEPMLDHGVDAFVAVDELRHAGRRPFGLFQEALSLRGVCWRRGSPPNRQQALLFIKDLEIGRRACPQIDMQTGSRLCATRALPERANELLC